jgi:hypothetical protein
VLSAVSAAANGPTTTLAAAAHARGDFEAERLALDRLALMERAAVSDTDQGEGER